jgi:NADH-quinone oxidoreductase subunit B
MSEMTALRLPAYLTTRLDKIVGWCRQYSIWPMPFATACCGIELMAVACSRYDIARFGAEALRFSPRQSDLLIVAGRVAVKMMPVLQRIYIQMPEPKWVISMGACASTGGEFDTYAVVQGVDQFLPVDVYLPGCPPRPENIMDGLMAIQKLCRDPSAASARPLGLVIPPGRIAAPPDLKPNAQDMQKPRMA